MSYEDWQDGSEAEQELADVIPTVTAPAPYAVPWSWSASSLLWVAGALLAASFGIWFLMSFNAARARSLAEVVTENE